MRWNHKDLFISLSDDNGLSHPRKRGLIKNWLFGANVERVVLGIFEAQGGLTASTVPSG